MSVGPEAPLALLIGSSIAQQQHLHSTDIDPLAWSALTTLFVGLFTLLLGIFRLGFLDSLMSRALLRGFITGVALVVMVQQSITLLGLVDRSIDYVSKIIRLFYPLFGKRGAVCVCFAKKKNITLKKIILNQRKRFLMKKILYSHLFF